MLHETVQLPVPGAQEAAELITYVPGNFPELGLDRQRPALIICPGGGYRFLSDREGEPVALRFAGLGYAAFVLRYHVAPQARWPIPQRQLLAAIDYVRVNCARYHVDPQAVIVMGFCAGLLWNRQEVYRPLKKKSPAFRPDGVILGYPVITSGPMAHQESLENLLGERRDELSGVVSLEKRVKRSAPPFFIWHTADDTSVPVENSLLLEKALRAKGIDAELHIFPHGAHGQSLADHTVFTASQAWRMSVPCAGWVARCDAWLQSRFGEWALSPEFCPSKARKK